MTKNTVAPESQEANMCRDSRRHLSCDRQRLTPTGVAAALHSYMAFRAKREGLGYRLSREFYIDGMRKGCHLFFGVEICCCGLVSDAQQPALFEEWLATKH